jgi:hypothetical protein
MLFTFVRAWKPMGDCPVTQRTGYRGAALWPIVRHRESASVQSYAALQWLATFELLQGGRLFPWIHIHFEIAVEVTAAITAMANRARHAVPFRETKRSPS